MSTNNNTYHRDGEGMEELLRLPVDVADEYRNWSLEEPDAKSEEFRLLEAVIDDPGKPSSSYLKLAKLGSGSKALETRKRLIKQGYLREYLLSKSGRGRTAIVLEPTPLAFELVDRVRKTADRRTP